MYIYLYTVSFPVKAYMTYCNDASGKEMMDDEWLFISFPL